MGLTEPAWLWLILPAVIVVVVAGLRSRHPMGPLRRGCALAVRCLLVAVLALALAGPWQAVESERLSVVAVLDASESVGTAGWERSLAQLAELAAGLPEGAELGVVAIADTPRVLRAPSAEPLATAELARPDAAARSDVAAALRLAAGVMPPVGARRVVLLSDGQATHGDAAGEAAAFATRGIVLDALPVAGDGRSDVRISALRTSHQRLHQGATLGLEAEIAASLDGEGVIRLFEDGVEVERRPLVVRAGEQRRVIFDRVPGGRGAVAYSVAVEGFPSDELPGNNHAEALVEVRGQPLVLYLSSDGRRGAELRRALADEGIVAEVREPRAMPTRLSDLIGYDGIVIDDVAAYDLGEARMRVIVDYVRRLGGGLTVLGGERSFGAGGYQRTPLSEALPVELRHRDREERRPTCLILVLDRSGSMSGEKIQLCKAAARATADLLSPKDFLGVVSFDSSPTWSVPVGRVGSGHIAAIDTIAAGGGTDVHLAMQHAWTGFNGIGAGAMHMIVVTDGNTRGGDLPALARNIANQGITISTVAIGTDAERGLLGTIAEIGGGTSYSQVDPSQLRAIFTQDTVRHLGRVIQEQPFIPVLAEQHIMVRDWPGEVPPLLGYVRTERKATAQVPLVTDQGDPLLAHWRFGLGKVTAWTSAADERWAPLWILQWPGFGPFWAQVLRETVRPPQGRFIDVALRDDGERVQVEVDLLADAASFANDAEVEAVVLHQDARRLGSQLDAETVLTCRQVAPGRYTASFRPERDGLFLVQVRSGPHLASAGLVRERAPEAATGTIDRPALQEWTRRTGGELLASAGDWRQAERGSGVAHRDLRDWCLIAALLLFMLDLLLRRWEHVQGIRDFFGRGRVRASA